MIELEVCTKNNTKGPGVVHGRLAVNEFMPSVSIKNLKIHTFAINLQDKDRIKKIGFKTSGTLNKISSFTPKNAELPKH